MPEPFSLRTERLLLRPWIDSDRDSLAVMCADPRVMEFFPTLMTRAESDAMFDRIQVSFADRGWGLWAVEVSNESRFAGFVGLAIPRFELPFCPCVEVGWRLARPFWGRGIATEAARAAIGFGFQTLGLREIVSYTAVENWRSRRVMERIGMTRDLAGDFDHPAIPMGQRLCRHVLYRLTKSTGCRTTTGEAAPTMS